MIATPPVTALSTPSPTELHDTNPLERDIVIPEMRPIYLVVATSRVTHAGGARLGIGYQGQLPWPMIKADMAFFRKVTTDGHETNTLSGESCCQAKRNAVLMGRKTWQSIPNKFRPLAGRLNVVVTRSNITVVANQILEELKARQDGKPDEIILDDIHTGIISIMRNGRTEVAITNNIDKATETDIRSMYCIGGAEIYGLLLKSSRLRPRVRILQTEVEKLDGTEFDCDTFWPEQLDDASSTWTEASAEQIQEWVGQKVPQDGDSWLEDTKAGVRLRVRGWQYRTG